ncbi:hypothetical protein HETIRDRAFT_173501 [Heterobasidion irregulare TC 32-1]|uniref:Uncharacterized protein n=1 Tax=Heterobasidion irregulare (strain TC 32-1) TaxID=747525 RepID=W4K7R1_HETIT|nr:uncharacterized protein HETIRDRAFT_173501 [Heterobasidion irregulare TC 32-1]ETW81823.1 hypothetical protein HETIRDRAFT_173501 [Heterobasidion irregulare TC 32-1]
MILTPMEKSVDGSSPAAAILLSATAPGFLTGHRAHRRSFNFPVQPLYSPLTRVRYRFTSMKLRPAVPALLSDRPMSRRLRYLRAGKTHRLPSVQ